MKTPGQFQPTAQMPAAQPIDPAPAAPSVTYPSIGTGSVYSDPSMLAFLRASGMSNEVAAADVARKQAAIQQALGISEDSVNTGGERSRRNIAGGMEARGVFRSGENLRAQGEQEANQGRQLSALRLAGAGQLGDLQTNLISQIAANQQRAAELGLTTAQKQDTQSQLAQAGLL